MDNRFTEIETNIAYQEHTIRELNDVVYRQQQQIDELERVITLLTDRFKNMLESTLTSKDTDEKPPHY